VLTLIPLLIAALALLLWDEEREEQEDEEADFTNTDASSWEVRPSSSMITTTSM